MRGPRRRFMQVPGGPQMRTSSPTEAGVIKAHEGSDKEHTSVPISAHLYAGHGAVTPTNDYGELWGTRTLRHRIIETGRRRFWYKGLAVGL